MRTTENRAITVSVSIHDHSEADRAAHALRWAALLLRRSLQDTASNDNPPTSKAPGPEQRSTQPPTS